MAPSTMYTRASSRLSSSSSASSSHPSALRVFASSNIKIGRNSAVRSLWWWSRHGTFSSTNDESIDERLQRHQKIMRHRYSRALRRRATWDRDDTNTPWLWHLPDGRLARKLGACRPLSSTDPTQAKLDGKDIDKGTYDRPDSTPWKDFEAFKAEVDCALARDPYGTLFGRRLQSPPTENNSSWISWLFNRGENVYETYSQVPSSPNKRKIDIEVLDKDGMSVKPQSTKSHITSEHLSGLGKSPSKTSEYVYDPITGRKVPRPLVKQNLAPQPQLSFLEALFAEHGSPPDKPVKQTRVHGYESQPQKQPTKTVSTESKDGSEITGGFGDSRSHEYRQLRATILGTSIDTTAVFGGKYNLEPETGEETPENRTRTLPDLDDTAPLFSGTTYESKADTKTPKTDPRSKSWLQKEGFQTEHGNKIKSPTSQKLEPSLDRIQSAPRPQERKSATRLQPAIDRVQPNKIWSGVSDRLSEIAMVRPTMKSDAVLTDASQSPTIDQREDVDLLRASDVRAATRVARTTKQETAQAKEQRRGELEKRFDTLQSVELSIQIPRRSELIPRPLAAVAQVTKAPTGGHVVDNKSASGLKMERFKVYQKPYKPGRIDLNEPLQFKDESLANVASIYKQKPNIPRHDIAHLSQDTPSEQKAKLNITESLRLMSKQAEEIRKKNDVQIVQLAEGIRQAYEAENGPIDLSLAQNSSVKPVHTEKIRMEQSIAKETSNEMNTFFSERAGFLAKVNDLKSHVTTLRSMATELETGVANKTITPSQEIARVAELRSEATTRLKEADIVGKELNKALAGHNKVSHPLYTATVKPGVPRYPAIERYTQVFEPQYIKLLNGVKAAKINLQAMDSSLHDLKRSRVRDVRQPAQAAAEESKPVAPPHTKEVEQPSTAIPLTSPYLLLVYNKTTGEVDQTALDRLPWSPNERVEKANPIKIMGNLNYPAAFVTHFVNLEKSGYELSNGGGDILVFQKINTSLLPKAEPKASDSAAPRIDVLRNKIAVEEASLQPEITETIAQPKPTTPTRAATVLEDIPVDIPHPGPAVPIAPPASPTKKPSRSGPKVRRQEQVFSGTIPVRSSSGSQQRPGQDSTSSSTGKNRSRTKDEQDPGFFARTTRTVKRGALGIAVFGAAAYTIGAVAEGLGAQAQVDGDAALGPRRKVVMPMGQRPGIYSTESSRVD